ncbi:hypothetical protein [Nonomuraea helvata]|uniref:Uncharacterized protein n=1 Tax=Nonomuraea helvata TaxID=37484 RepID=A0ABV5SBG8_9ACTN
MCSRACSLIAGGRPAGTPTPDGRAVDGTWSQVRFDIVLAPAGA